jgi:hypothetical protein
MPLTPEFLPGETVSASKLQLLGTLDTSWQPTLTAIGTNPTLGTGAVRTSYIWRNGNAVEVWFNITFGSSGVNAGSGNYYLLLPVMYPPIAGFYNSIAIGEAHLYHPSTDQHSSVALILASSTLYMTEVATLIHAGYPWTWSANDVIQGHYRYLT